MIKAKEINERQVSTVNVRAANLAIERCRKKLPYAGPVKLHWFVTDIDRAFTMAKGTIFEVESPYGFVPIKTGEPEVWLRAAMEPELVAHVTMHEMRHVPDLARVFELESLAKSKGLKPNDDHWATWLYRQKVQETENEAEWFQRLHGREAEFIGAMARRVLA